MNDDAISNHLNSLAKKSSNSDDSYTLLIKNWFHRQLLGLFPIIGDKESSNVDLRDHWTEIKRKNILFGRCVSLELGEDIVVAKVEGIKRNLSKRIISVKVSLEDDKNTKITLFTEIGKTILQKEIEELKKKTTEGVNQEEIKDLEEKLINGNRKFVYWQNNCEETPDLEHIEPLLEDLVQIRENMKWDREKSRKQIIVPAVRAPNPDAWNETKKSLEEDYICVLVMGNEMPTEENMFRINDPQNKQQDLWDDHYKTFDFLRRMVGILHNTNKKKERHNVPEMEIMESQFLTYQQEKRELLEKSIREFMKLFGGNYRIIPIELVEEDWTRDNIPDKEIKKELKEQEI